MAKKAKASHPEAPANCRWDLIRELQTTRESQLVVYFLSDRRGASGGISEDAVRPMFDHLRAIGDTDRVDVLLYSVGGNTEVPWRIVSMIRECCKEFSVLIPYKAMSAATMIALGADSIVMGKKGELGPIDPSLNIRKGPDEEGVAVEDVMSYVRFLGDRVGLSDQAALSGPIVALGEKLPPILIGKLNRMHSHIRSVARKLLTSHTKEQLDEQKIGVIVETLAEKTYQHGHAIGRQEAGEIGLPVHKAEPKIEELMWRLYCEYEKLACMRTPVDPFTFIPEQDDKHQQPVCCGMIESVEVAHHFTGTLVMRRKRKSVPELQLNLNFNLQLPASVDPAQLPEEAQQILQQIMQQLQQALPQQIQDELNKRMPVEGFEGHLENARWRAIDNWPKVDRPA